MKDKTFHIKTFEQLIQIGTTFAMNWFRGQSKIYGNLSPSVFRSPYYGDLIRIFEPDPELRFYHEFIRKAPSFSEKLPEPKDNMEWLIIMQHHGLPTRLLDWSENILCATYFAVVSDPDFDAEIWTFLPWHLNQKHGFWGTPLPTNSIMKYFASEPFHNDSEKLAKELELEKEPIIPLAVLPTLRFQRMCAQQSCFTIHRPPEIGLKLEDVITEENMLTRYIISASKKKEFLFKLDSLGVNKSTLFPDLDGLANSIKELSFSVGWGQPKLLKLEKYLNETNPKL